MHLYRFISTQWFLVGLFYFRYATEEQSILRLQSKMGKFVLLEDDMKKTSGPWTALREKMGGQERQGRVPSMTLWILQADPEEKSLTHILAFLSVFTILCRFLWDRSSG